MSMRGLVHDFGLLGFAFGDEVPVFFCSGGLQQE